MSNQRFNAFTQPAADVSSVAEEGARARQLQLTKPAGSLGLLEQVAIQFAGFQHCECPVLERIYVAIFAADHGVCAHGVSLFPQAVTGQMVANFAAGGAAVNVLSRRAGAKLQVINVGTTEPLPEMAGVLERRIAAGTCDFTLAPAMSVDQCLAAMAVGAEQATAAQSSHAQLCIGGEMGIGNTTSAAAIYSALLNIPPAQAVGPGTGVGAQGLLRKQQVVELGLERHRQVLADPWQVMSCLGGFEIAALTGFYIAAAQRGIPCLLDGFISTAAALLAVAINPSVRPWLLYAHRSAEPAHALVLVELDAQPLLDLGMRLGEGSGALAAVPLIQSALALHTEMATFADAGVADG